MRPCRMRLCKTLTFISISILFLVSGPHLMAKDRFFNSSGVKIRYIDQGEGEPVALLHGLCGDIEQNWKAPGVIKSLSKRFRVIAMDLRGHGKSDRPGDPMGYGLEMAKDLIRLLDHLKIEKSHLVGFSYGGTVALKVMATWPERLLSVVLAETSWAKAGDKEFVDYYDNLARSLEEGKGFSALLRSLSAESETPIPEEELEKINKAMSQMFDFKRLAMLLKGSRELGVAELSLKNNPVPCLVLYGEKSKSAREGAAAMKAAMKKLDMVSIKKGDHFNILLMPDFLKSLKQHLIKYSPGS